METLNPIKRSNWIKLLPTIVEDAEINLYENNRIGQSMLDEIYIFIYNEIAFSPDRRLRKW